MDALRVHRFVESVKCSGVRFDTHDLEDRWVLVQLGLDGLTDNELGYIRRELEPLAEAYQSAEVRRTYCGTLEDDLVW